MGFGGEEYQKQLLKEFNTIEQQTQFLPSDDDSEREEFIIYQVVINVPEAMARIIEEKINSSKGIQFKSYFL